MDQARRRLHWTAPNNPCPESRSSGNARRGVDRPDLPQLPAGRPRSRRRPSIPATAKAKTPSRESARRAGPGGGPRPKARLVAAWLAVEPEDVVHPVLLGGWWCQSPSTKEKPDEAAR